MTRLVFETKRMKVAELGEESSVPDLFGELTTQNSLVFDLDEDDEIYEGYGKVNSAFPYRQLNGYTRELHEKDVKTANSELSVPQKDPVPKTPPDVYKRQEVSVTI